MTADKQILCCEVFLNIGLARLSMAGSLDTATSSIGSSLEFVMKNYKALLAEMAKVYVLGFGITMAALAVCAILLLAFGGAALVSGGAAAMGMLLPFIVAALIVLFLAGIASTCVMLARFPIIDGMARKSRPPILGTAGSLLSPVAVYSVIMAVLALIVLGVPLAISLFAFSGGGGGALLVAVALLVVMILIWIVIAFFVQFAQLGMVMNGQGAIDALRGSAALVRKNMATVLVFDIGLFVISFAVGIVFSIINQVFVFAISLAAVNIVLLALLFLLYIALVIIEGVVISAVVSPVQLFFWKTIGGKR